MKKSLMALTLAAFAIVSTACGISALEPEPVALKMGYFGTMALVDEGVPNTFKACGKDVKEFRQTLKNGFKHIASEKVPITSPELADSVLKVDEIQVSCMGDQYFDGAVLKLDYKIRWIKRDGSEIARPGMSLAGAKDVKKALLTAVENMFNDSVVYYLEMNQVAPAAK
ncbi:MAG: hypothetical protein WC966_10345 [Bradymonadales bacterium]|jgi:hypothetical protein